MELPLNATLESKDITRLIKKYHFRSEDRRKLEGLYIALEPLLQIRGFFTLSEATEDIPYPFFAVCFLSLGDGIDALQQFYTKRKLLSEAYMLDCLGLELLWKCYPAFTREIQHYTGQWAASLDFLDDDPQLSMLPTLYDMVRPQGISYNKSLMLIPAKSIYYLVPLAFEPPEKDIYHICDGCKNKTCPLHNKSPH